MTDFVHRPAWRSRGWMSFTLANNAVLHLGGNFTDNGTTVRTLPDAHISNGVSDATGFLAAGIPQTGDKSRFLDTAVRSDGTFAHAIKHAIIKIAGVGGAAASPYARFLDDGSTPTSALGEVLEDSLEYHNSRDAIRNFKLINVSGGTITVTVRPYE